MKSYNPKIPKSIAKSVKGIRALHEGIHYIFKQTIKNLSQYTVNKQINRR